MGAETVQILVSGVQKGDSMLSQIHAAGLFGIEAERVEVEVDISNGLPGWQFVGLPETAVKESKERVTAAIRNSGIQILARKITVNLSPAQWKKSGAFFDLPIALGVLVASEIVPASHLTGYLCIGELSLKGEVLRLPGILPIVMSIRKAVAAGKIRGVILPASNLSEAQWVTDVPLIGVSSLQEVLQFLETGEAPQHVAVSSSSPKSGGNFLDMKDVRGQQIAKRAMVIAAAGGHNLLMVSPPGSGKTMLAERFASLLPALCHDHALDASRIYSAAGKLTVTQPFVQKPPFRAPHHTASAAAVCGGGQGLPMPGEVSLAHHGVLFMDELPEFRRDVLEALREPLESGRIVISRAYRQVSFPARFQLIAAMNPCPCGYYGHPKIACQCSVSKIVKYRQRVSGPLMDRIDLQIQLHPVLPEDLMSDSVGIPSADLAHEVMACRARQRERFGKEEIQNAHIPPQHLKTYCALDAEGTHFVEKILKSGQWSARGFHRMLRVARTIADLEGAPTIRTAHLAEALQYRQLDRQL